jgi:hypothetical protein
VSQGKRAGTRKGRRGPIRLRPAVLGYAAAITGAVVAWGFLVFAAINFGVNALNGQTAGWAFLALASLGAVACLFVGLMLLARLGRALGLTAPPALNDPGDAARTSGPTRSHRSPRP